MTTNYQRGYRAEIKVRRHLEDSGWKVVRAGGSKGEADLVAFKFDSPEKGHLDLLFVQVKRNMRVPSKEMKAFLRAFPPGEFFSTVKVAGAVVRDRKPGIEFEFYDGKGEVAG